MQKSNINPAIYQSFLDSARNAGEKGQAQWFTPAAWAKVLGLPLPRLRTVTTDLSCGNGQLLAAIGRGTLLGCDIEPIPNSEFRIPNLKFVAADVTRFAPLLHAVKFQCDLFTLNPPYDLHWYRDRFPFLAESLPAVRAAFAAHDGRTSKDTIDSTIASLCLALHFGSPYSEGVLVANHDTLERLIFRPGAPHGALAQHIWARLVIPGNICGKPDPQSTFKTGVIWFAAGHKTGLTRFPERNCGPEFPCNAAAAALQLARVEKICEDIKEHRLEYRTGAERTKYTFADDSADLWAAAKEEWLRTTGGTSSTSPQSEHWNLDLRDGLIITDLSLFDRKSSRVTQKQAETLHELNGKRPMALVMQRTHRKALESAVFGGIWRVSERLQAAVTEAIAEYHAQRAPLVPLPAIQRLGYLDEEDVIECIAECGVRSADFKSEIGNRKSEIIFRRGEKYSIRTLTIQVQREGEKFNLMGGLDDVEWNGAELAFFITDTNGTERLFMDERNRDPKVKLALRATDANDAKNADVEERLAQSEARSRSPIEFTLQELVAHFRIPEVPDVATLKPDQLAHHTRQLTEIERLCGGFTFKKFQRHDYARAALHDGCILGHDTGGGKGIAAFIWPLLKCGFTGRDGMLPSPNESGTAARPSLPGGIQVNAPVLIVAPGDLHQQMKDEARDKFRLSVTALDSQEAFLTLAKVDPLTGARRLPPGFYLTSYTQLTTNGVAKFPPLADCLAEADQLNSEFGIRNSEFQSKLGITQADLVEYHAQRAKFFRKEYGLLAPMSDLADDFDAWVLNVTLAELTKRFNAQHRATDNEIVRREINDAFCRVKPFTPAKRGGKYADLDHDQRRKVITEHIRWRWEWCAEGIGESRKYESRKQKPDGGSEVSTFPISAFSFSVKCVYSPALADLAQDAFECVVVDEGVKMKGMDTIVGKGVRQMNPKYRLILTATPVKNRLPDIFPLAWWATGAQDVAHGRFPYQLEDIEEFADEFMITERNLSAEARAEAAETGGRFVKRTPQVCNVHRLWKLFAPVILRRRKADFGEDIVAKARKVVRVPMGTKQALVYRYHLDAEYKDKNGRPAIGAQLQALRIAAANPASLLLQRPPGDTTGGLVRSDDSFCPKLNATLNLILQVMERGEQVIVFSAFHDSLDALHHRLNETGIKHLVLDGRVSQAKRAAAAKQFKSGPPKFAGSSFSILPSSFPVMLAGVECMAEGHSFHACNNVILMAYSWAYDKFEQAINRVHRLNSVADVNVYPVICEGSIDRKLEAMIQEKGDAAELVLDGKLLAENAGEVNLAELLHIARKEFDPKKDTIEEYELEKGWPKLRHALSRAGVKWAGVGVQPLGCSAQPDTLKRGLQPTAAWRKRVYPKPPAGFSDLPLFNRNR